jgi:hypothetical protein
LSSGFKILFQKNDSISDQSEQFYLVDDDIILPDHTYRLECGSRAITTNLSDCSRFFSTGLITKPGATLVFKQSHNFSEENLIAIEPYSAFGHITNLKFIDGNI